MRGSQKSKSVTWAPDGVLCQVRLFLSDECPSQVGLAAQDHLQAKASWLLHSTGMGFDENLPPGFEGAHSVNKLKKEVSQIPLIKWQCPPKFMLNLHWQVVAGEESKERDDQLQRELRVLEAVYPHQSAIPQSPSVSSDVESCHFDDNETPAVPMTAIEDEDMNDPSSSLVMPISNATTSQPPMLPSNILASGNYQISHGGATSGAPRPPTMERTSIGVIPGVEPDVVAAASAAFTAIMRSNEQGSLIDPELLVKILSNPKLIEKLVSDYGPANPPAPMPATSPPVNLSVSQTGVAPIRVARIEPEPPLPVASTVHFHHATNLVTSPPPPVVPMLTAPAMKVPPVKDINYYKSLIQLHGEERPETNEQTVPQFGNRPVGVKTDHLQSSKPRDNSKPKIMKPCIYFNSSRGCKHGANCAYQHDISAQPRIGSASELPTSKRMKLDREITGRT